MDLPPDNFFNDVTTDDPARSTGSGRWTDLGKRAAVVWSVGALIAVGVIGVWYAVDVLLLIFAGLLFAVFLRSVSRWLSRHTLFGEKTSLALVVLGLAVGVFGAGWLMAAPLTEQVDQLQQTLPQSVERLQERVAQYPWGRWALNRAPSTENLLPGRRDVFAQISGFVSGTFGAIGGAVVIFFVGLFVASQPELYRRGLLILVPRRRRNRARDILDQVGSALQGWLLGMLVSMVIVGVLSWLGLFALGIEMALALAVLAALLTFIPNFGPILAAVPAVLAGLLQSPMTAVWVIALYLAIQTVESYLITPMIQQQAISLPPALTITSQLILGVLTGALGLAMATPLTAALLVLVRTIYVEDLLGEEPTREG
jgi:predicted PurR-regulated permease PerM